MTFKFKGVPFIDKISIPDYNALPCLRSSDLKEFMKSPSHYKWSQMHREEEPDNKNLILGSYVHAAILEPETLSEQFIVIDMKTRHNKEYHAAAAVAAKTGKSVILSGEKRDAEYMVENVLNDPHVMELIGNCYPEISAAAQLGGVWAKCRMDGYIPEAKTMLDIKTTGESIYWFAHNVKRWGYDISAPLYMDVVNAAAKTAEDPVFAAGIDTYVFVVIEKAAPFGVRIFRMSESYLAVGRTKYMAALPVFKNCLDTNVWPGYDNSTYGEIEPPRNELDNLSPNQRVENEQL